MPEFVRCNLCSGTEYRFLPNKTDCLKLPEPLRVVRCERCGLVYMNPRFTPEEHGEYFVDSTFYKSYLMRVERMVSLFSATYKVLEGVFGRCGSLLEVGCATGHFLWVGQQRGWQVVGLEISASLAQYARDEFGLDVRIGGGVKDVGFNAGEFDVVYISHVLEHLHDPRDTLECVHSLIKDDGLLVVQVPNEFEDLLFILFGRSMKNRFRRDGLPTDHLYFFTPQTIGHLLEGAGFQVIQMSTWAWRNQRNLLRSRFAGGYLLKVIIFSLGGFIGRGPNIEVFAKKA